MFFLYKLAGGLATPPGCFFALLIPLSFWVMKRQRWAGGALFAMIVMMYALFMPATARFLMARLEIGRPVLPQDSYQQDSYPYQKPTLVAVLAGGGTHPVPGVKGETELTEQSFQRLMEGVKAARLLGCPLVYSGGYGEGDQEDYRNAIQKLVADASFNGEFLLETRSRTSLENMQEISKIVNARGFERVAISTTAYHMRRALWTAAQIMPDVEIIPWPSGWRSTRDRLTLGAFGASARAFLDSCAALREYAGLAAYKIQAALALGFFP